PAVLSWYRGNFLSFISLDSSLLPQDFTIHWGWYFRILRLLSTPNCRSNGCAPFWSSRYRQVRKSLFLRTVTSPLTMYPFPTGKATAYWKMSVSLPDREK